MRIPVFQSDHNTQSSGKWAFLDPDPCVYNKKKEKIFILRYLMISAIKILMLISIPSLRQASTFWDTNEHVQWRQKK